MHAREKLHITPHCPTVQILQGLHRTGDAVKLVYILFLLPLFCKTQCNTARWWEGFFLNKITPGCIVSHCSTTCCIRVSYRDSNELLLDTNLLNLERLWHNWWIMQKFKKLSAVLDILFCLLVSSIYSPCVSYSLVILPDLWGYRTLPFFPHWKDRDRKEQEQPQASL